MAILTHIIEGPREDGRARFLCEECGRSTGWVLVPGANAIRYRHHPHLHNRVEHFCKLGRAHVNRLQAADSPSVPEKPCADSLISAAYNALVQACQVAESSQLQDAIKAVVEQFRDLRRLALLEAQAKKDKQDGTVAR